MTAPRPGACGVRFQPLYCEILETRFTLDGALSTILPGGEVMPGLSEAVRLCPQTIPTSGLPAPSPAEFAAPAHCSSWHVAAPFPILVTALLVTLCGQVELLGGRNKPGSWRTPLL